MISSRRPLSRFLVAASLVGLAACSASDKDGEATTPTNGAAKGFKTPPAEAGDSGDYTPISEPSVPVNPGFGIDLNNHRGIPHE